MEYSADEYQAANLQMNLFFACLCTTCEDKLLKSI